MLHGPVQAAKKPTYPQCNEGARIGLGLDRVTKPLIDLAGPSSRGIGRFAVDVLRDTGYLVSHAFALGLDVACCAAKAFFDLAAQIARSSLKAIFIHISFS
jgi:hypothetical protein